MFALEVVDSRRVGDGDGRSEARAIRSHPRTGFRLHVFVRDDWHEGKDVSIVPLVISDKDMREFHLQGFAREYDMTGVINRKFRWTVGEKIPQEQLLHP